MARRYVIKQDSAPSAPISGIDYHATLNEEQYAAVSSAPGAAFWSVCGPAWPAALWTAS